MILLPVLGTESSYSDNALRGKLVGDPLRRNVEEGRRVCIRLHEGQLLGGADFHVFAQESVLLEQGILLLPVPCLYAECS